MIKIVPPITAPRMVPIKTTPSVTLSSTVLPKLKQAVSILIAYAKEKVISDTSEPFMVNRKFGYEE